MFSNATGCKSDRTMFLRSYIKMTAKEVFAWISMSHFEVKYMRRHKLNALFTTTIVISCVLLLQRYIANYFATHCMNRKGCSSTFLSLSLLSSFFSHIIIIIIVLFKLSYQLCFSSNLTLPLRLKLSRLFFTVTFRLSQMMN